MLSDRPSCVVLGHQSVIHTNTHTIHKYDKDEYKHYKTKDALLFYLHERFEPELKALLNQYLSSRINEDLHVPPTQVIRLDGLRKK